jgi:hypothetical protein
LFWRTRKRSPEVHVQPAVRFVGAQDGETERLLKNALIAELRDLPEVQRAYLAQVKYADEVHVALCLAAPENRSIVERMGSVFAGIFSREQHLDIMFIQPDLESELERVCPPFYRSS